MGKRKNIRPKERFSIFERDNFTCQYCGRTPDQDNVVLEVDHIVSVKDGGKNNKENLITSCFDCNRGKGAKSKPKKTIEQIEDNIDREQERLKQLKRINKKQKELNDIKEETKKLSRQWIFDIIGEDMSEKIYSIVEKTVKKHNNKKAVKETLEVMSVKDFETIKQWVSYFNGVLKRKLLTKEENKILCLYDTILDKNCYKYGEYDWKAGNQLKAVQKAIDDLLYMPLSFHEAVIKDTMLERDTLWGKTFKLSARAREYIKYPQGYTIYKSNKQINLHLIDNLMIAYEKELNILK